MTKWHDIEITGQSDDSILIKIVKGDGVLFHDVIDEEQIEFKADNFFIEYKFGVCGWCFDMRIDDEDQPSSLTFSTNNQKCKYAPTLFIKGVVDLDTNLFDNRFKVKQIADHLGCNEGELYSSLVEQGIIEG